MVSEFYLKYVFLLINLNCYLCEINILNNSFILYSLPECLSNVSFLINTTSLSYKIQTDESSWLWPPNKVRIDFTSLEKMSTYIRQGYHLQLVDMFLVLRLIFHFFLLMLIILAILNTPVLLLMFLFSSCYRFFKNKL